MDTITAYCRLDSARNDRDALNKRIAAAKADILELLAARGLLNWKDAGTASNYLSDMMDDITSDAREAVNEELDGASNAVVRIEDRDMQRSAPI